MIYVRGQPEDFDHWGQLGNRGWSWDNVLPYFKKAEDWESGGDAFHGAGGPLLTSRTADKPALCQVMIEAGRELGLEYRDDVNHRRTGGKGRGGGRGDPRRRRDRLAASVAAERGRRPRPSRPGRYPAHPCVARGRQEPAGPFPRPG